MWNRALVDTRLTTGPGATAVTIPYRCNRAAIFDGMIVHSTDEFRFKDGYENRRINITLLYGRTD